jgi:hypothetical protein
MSITSHDANPTPLVRTLLIFDSLLLVFNFVQFCWNVCFVTEAVLEPCLFFSLFIGPAAVESLVPPPNFLPKRCRSLALGCTFLMLDIRQTGYQLPVFRAVFPSSYTLNKMRLSNRGTRSWYARY